MRWAWILGISAAAGACVQSRSVVCEDGRICPEGTVCAVVGKSDGTDAKLCVSPDAIRACDGKQQLDECEIAGAPGEMRCYDEVCLPAGCGNSLADPGEACDDGNAVTGDGCSVGCQSDERCGNGFVDPVVIIDPVTGVVAANEDCDDGNLIGHDGCSSQCQAESVQWSQLGFARPGARSSHAIAYDAARRRFVMFGGGSSSFSGETLESDGNGWVKLPAPVAPSGRSFHAMVYDAARRRVVLFGGYNGSPLGDTWEWDGLSWKLRNTQMSAPEPRYDHAMAYDAARQRVVLFGGLVRSSVGGTTTASSKTWEWDGTAWKGLDIAGPPGRHRHAMAFDPVRGVIVMGGGQTITNMSLLDTWLYDAAGWREVPNAMTPEHLDSSAVAFDHVTRRVVAFSGRDMGDPVNQMSAWDGQRWLSVSPGSVPPVREGSRMASDPFTGRILLFGGYTSSPGPAELDDTWAWNGATWTQLIPVSPGLITRAAVAHDPLRARLVLFGGLDGQATPVPLGDTWELGATGWTRFPGSPASPSPRVGTALAYDAARRQTVLFGGGSDFSNASMRDDTWTWNGATWTAHPVAVRPSARTLHAMSYDARERSVLLVGGYRQGFLGDVWKWDGSSWTLTDPASLPPRYAHAMVYDPIRESTLLFGGGASLIFDEARTWKDSAWTPLTTPISPAGRDAHRLAWDGSRARVVLFGGFGPTSLLEDLWEWDGVQWQPSSVVAPLAARAGYAMWPAPDGAGLIVFGGDTSRLRPGFPLPRAAFGDTWRLRHDGPGPYEICAGAYDNDQDGLVGCADLDCWSVCTPMCPPGATCAAADPRCGDGTCNTALENCRICPADCSCPAVCGDFLCDSSESAAGCPGDCP